MGSEDTIAEGRVLTFKAVVTVQPSSLQMLTTN